MSLKSYVSPFLTKIASGADIPLTCRSCINSTGPGAVTLTKPVSGSPSVFGHVSRSVALPVIVTGSPCLTVSVEKLTSVNATVSIRRNPSWAFSPCAETTAAVPSAAPSPRMSETSNVRFILMPPRSEALDEAPDRPDRQPAGDQLANPVAGNGYCRAEDQRHVLRFFEEAAQRAILDQSQIFRRLAAEVLDALHVGDGQNVSHELGRLQVRRQRHVVAYPERKRPHHAAQDGGQDETLRLEQDPIQEDRRRNDGGRPDEYERITDEPLPLEHASHPGAQKHGHGGVRRASWEAPRQPLDVLQRGGDDDERERRNDWPPLAVLPVRPEVPVTGEQEFGDIRGGADDKGRRNPEDQIELVVEPAISLVQQAPQLLAFSLRRGDSSSSCSHVGLPLTCGLRDSLVLGVFGLFLDTEQPQCTPRPQREDARCDPAVRDERPV